MNLILLFTKLTFVSKWLMAKLKERDSFVNARRVVELAVGEQMDGKPLINPDAGKNPAAVALGKLGGAKGGHARAQDLTNIQKRGIAQKAAKARWNGTAKKKD